MHAIAQKLRYFDYFHEIMQYSDFQTIMTVCQHLVNIEST